MEAETLGQLAECELLDEAARPLTTTLNTLLTDRNISIIVTLEQSYFFSSVVQCKAKTEPARVG